MAGAGSDGAAAESEEALQVSTNLQASGSAASVRPPRKRVLVDAAPSHSYRRSANSLERSALRPPPAGRGSGDRSTPTPTNSFRRPFRVSSATLLAHDALIVPQIPGQDQGSSVAGSILPDALRTSSDWLSTSNTQTCWRSSDMAARPITVHRPRTPAKPASMHSAVHSSACRHSCTGAPAASSVAGRRGARSQGPASGCS